MDDVWIECINLIHQCTFLYIESTKSAEARRGGAHSRSPGAPTAAPAAGSHKGGHKAPHRSRPTHPPIFYAVASARRGSATPPRGCSVVPPQTVRVPPLGHEANANAGLRPRSGFAVAAFGSLHLLASWALDSEVVRRRSVALVTKQNTGGETASRRGGARLRVLYRSSRHLAF